MYQSIYRKYRPQTFMEIYGQNAISLTLTNAIVKDRVAHAYLFSGPRGTGKTSTAKLLAKALNCTNIIDGKICDECENCILVKSNSHPDIIEIDAASNNGVDEVRDLIEKVKYAPIMGKKKVYIIDEVHMMSQGAFNALLKTLEEPPEHVVFILATTEQHKVIATIKSRCQKFNFKKIAEKDIIDCLVNILVKENCTYDIKALDIIASLCDGGMRDALSILEQIMIYSDNDISVDAVNESLDLVAQEKIIELYEYIKARKLEKSLDFVNQLNKTSVDYKQVMNALIKIAMDELINIRVEDSDSQNQKYLLNIVEKLDESLEKLKYDNSKKLYLDLAIIKIINSDNKKNLFKIEDIVPVEKNVLTTLSKITKQNDEVVEDKGLEENDKLVDDINNHVEERVLEPSVIKKEKIVNQNLVTEDELMNILVQATRSDLDFVKDKWELLDDYLININTKKSAGMLIESVPVAASKDAMIVVCKEVSEVTLINNTLNINSIAHFIDDMMKESRFCFAVSTQTWLNMKDKYLELRKNNQLPEARTVLENFVLSSSKPKQDNEVAESELLSFGKKLFKDKLIIKREEEDNEY